MKSYLYLCLFFYLIPFRGNTQTKAQPEQIYSVIKVIYPLSYYHQQAELWEAEIEISEQNAKAWSNYYAACRAANLLTPSTKSKPYNLDSIIRNVATAIPETYEYHHLTYWHGGGNQDLFEHLEKAFALDPDRPEIYDGMITHHELNRNPSKKKFFCKKVYEAGAITPEILSWNYNVLMSVEEDAILLTYGDNDTYPVWLLQDVKNIRTDVTVLNVHLLQKKEYRDQIFDENGIAFYAPQAELVADRNAMFSGIMSHIFNHQDRPIYLGVAVSRSIREMFKSNLYLVGLAFKYSKTEFDNIAVLKNNYENKFLLDFLKIDLNPEVSSSISDKMNTNLIPAFLLLYKHYKASGEKEKTKELRALLTKIALAGGVEDQVLSYFESNPQPSERFDSVIPIKSLERGKEKIRDDLYADHTEVSIEAYDQFLMDLLKQKEYKKLDQCRPAKTKWRTLAKERLNKRRRTGNKILINEDKDSYADLFDHSRLPDDTLFIHHHPDDSKCPVHSITYEAASFYCEWITEVYNRSNTKKKKFKRVLFRLPSEQEWEWAAKAGNKQAQYAQGGEQVTNAKGCFLYNYNVTGKSCKGQTKNLHAGNDGAFFTTAVDAYHPNELGLYNMSGNVAEMIAEKGKAKGGSWADDPDQSKIESVQSYQNADPTIGFRVFMEVLEY